MASIDEITIKLQIRIVRVERNPHWRRWKFWTTKQIETEFSSLEAAIGKEESKDEK